MIERIRESVSKSPLFKGLLLILPAVVVLVFYFKIFFTKGIIFEGAFLRKEVVSSESQYSGRHRFGDIHITVKGSKNKDSRAEVTFRLPNNINRYYIVEFENPGDWDSSMIKIKNRSGSIIVEGKYRKDYSFLFNKSGEPVFDSQLRIAGENPFDASYRVPLSHVAALATFSTETIRGRFGFLFIAVVMIVITAIDIKYPLFFFHLRHWLTVRDPEPSEFYLFMQRLSWFITPVIAIILMILAVNWWHFA